MNNPMIQLARMYAVIEAALRRAAQDKTPMSISELRALPEVADIEKSPWQSRDILKVLVKKGFVEKYGDSRNSSYAWNLRAPAFTFKSRQRERMMTAPSEPVVVKPEPTKEAAHAAVEIPPAKDSTLQNKAVEFVFHGVEIVVGINPVTGNLRLQLDKI